TANHGECIATVRDVRMSVPVGTVPQYEQEDTGGDQDDRHRAARAMRPTPHVGGCAVRDLGGGSVRWPLLSAVRRSCSPRARRSRTPRPGATEHRPVRAAGGALPLRRRRAPSRARRLRRTSRTLWTALILLLPLVGGRPA